MNPYGRNEKRLDTYLSQLLWAIAQKFGGEFRLASDELDVVPDKCAIVTDWDSVHHELVIRAATGQSEMVAVNTEQQWARPSSTAENLSSGSTPRQRTDGSVPRSALHLDDGAMAEIENRLLRRAASRREQKEADDLNKARRDL